MKKEIIYVILLLNIGRSFSEVYNRTIMSQLQELCPYSSFCEENATMHFPESDTKRPCCESCSCKPGCEKDDKCCFIRNDPGRTCMPPTTNRKAIVINYMMIHSCLNKSTDSDYNNNKTMCTYNDSDYESFAPVVSEKSGDIFVNYECAICNKALDIIHWTLTYNCPSGIYVLLDSENLGNEEGCYLSYVPPKHLNLQSQECRNDVIRDCNVSGKANEWRPFWDYCPIINAPFTTLNNLYGNIFCFLCNESVEPPVLPTCFAGGNKHLTNVRFIAVLDNVDFKELNDGRSVKNSAKCRPTDVFVHSVKSECRRVECSFGKIRIGGKCRFYSKEWFGGRFVTVFKLTPLDKTVKIDISLLNHLKTNFKDDKKAAWIKRTAMKNWNVIALYRPSANNRFIEYFVVQLSFPRASVNPARLWTSMSQALKETWTLYTQNNQIRLQVRFNPYESYQKTHKTELLKYYGIKIHQEYGFVNSFSDFADNEERYLFAALSFDDDHSQAMPVFLNELFLCDVIALRPDELLRKSLPRLVLKATNQTLHETEYRIVARDTYICLNRIFTNNGLNTVYYLRDVVFVELIFVIFTKIYSV